MPPVARPLCRVAVLAPMPGELRPLVRLLGLPRVGSCGGHPLHAGSYAGRDVVATGTGIGPALATAAAGRVLDAGPVDLMVVCGIAGGIAPLTAVGDLVVPAEVLDGPTGERFLPSAVPALPARGLLRTGTGDAEDYRLDEGALAALRAAGVVAVDMETAAVARVCQARGVRWVAVRAISDLAGDASVGEVVMTLVRPDGSHDLAASARYFVRRPGHLPRMLALGRDAARAARTAARAAARVLEGV